MATDKNDETETSFRRSVEKIYSTEEVAQLLGKTTASVRRYARQGALVRVIGKGMQRSIGFTASSVRRLVEGGAE